MSKLSSKQIPPPSNWKEFEELCADLWKEIWKDPNVQMHGRTGQAQHGVDVYGQLSGIGDWKGIQCKGKDGRFKHNPVTERELKDEVKKAKGFSPEITEFILATTAPNDGNIQKIAREITKEHITNGQFTVYVMSWDEIVRRLEDYPHLVDKYYEGFGSTNKRIEEKLDQVLSRQISAEASKSDAISQINPELVAEVIRQLGITPNVAQTADCATINPEEQSLNREIDSYRDLIYSKPCTALELLKDLRDKSWGQASNQIRFRLITNIGAAYSVLDKMDTASEFFLEAIQYSKPDDDKAERNIAYAYLITGRKKEAQKHAHKSISLNPDEPDGYSLLISASTENSDLGSPEDLVPNNMLESPTIAYSLGHFYRLRGEKDKTIAWLEKACNLDQSSLHYKAALGTELLIEVINKDGAGLEGYLSSNDLLKLERAVELLDSVWIKVKDTELVGSFSWVGVNLCNALLVLQREHEVKEMIPELSKYVPDFLEFRKLAALYELEYGMPKNAIEHLSYIARGTNSEIDLLRAQAMAQASHPDEALKELKKISFENDDKRLVAIAFQIRLISEISGPKEAISAARELGKECPDNLMLLVSISKQYQEVNEKKAAMVMAAKAFELLNSGSTISERIQVADCLYSMGSFSNAHEVYVTLLHNYNDSQILRRTVICLYQIDQRASLLRLFRKIPDTVKSLKFYRRISAALFMRIGEVEKAFDEANAYLELEPNDLGMRLNWIGMHQRLGSTEKIEEYLSINDVEHIEASVSDLTVLASLLVHYGFVERGIKLAYKTLRDYPNLSDTHSAYISLLLLLKDTEGVLDVSTVGIDSAFVLEDASSNQQVFIIESDSSGKGFPEEIPPSHHLAQLVMGKRIGDKVKVTINPFQSEERTIVGLNVKYIYMLQKTMAEYSHRFPEQTNLWALNVRGDKEGEYDFSAVFKALDHRNSYTTQVLDLYQNENLPVGFISKMLGNHPLEVWADLMRSNDIKIKCCDGNHVERGMALEITQSNSNGLVVDPLALYSIVTLGIQDEIKRTFGSLGVVQSTLDSYRAFVGNIRNHPPESTMGKDGDQYVLDEHTPEQIESYLGKYEKILRWAENHCEIIPAVGTQDLSPQWAELFEGIDSSFVDSVLAASGTGRLLLSDDQHLRVWAKANLAVDGIWLQIAMIRSVSQGYLPINRYAEALAYLVEANIGFISVDSNILLSLGELAGWKVSRQLKLLLSTLGGKYIDINSAAFVAVRFIVSVWNQPYLPAIFPKFTYALLNALVADHSEQTNFYIRQLIDVADSVPVQHKKHYLGSIKHWCDGHFISRS